MFQKQTQLFQIFNDLLFYVYVGWVGKGGGWDEMG